ncbi:VOC family protein [Pseudonocardia alni]|uniref:Catechol 2,3-dioxygenase-like lactoylglutathione lyase family enzyme n=1 Tax=Pseudonocardia alni TaxID=33907 RepID=A0A852W9W3_PSEA5|nr:VOC family protein [Pseudonocardia antarctica]NYG04131.1 catechol 2,3-dioxygenase-like lactoylglutathione lyase family enzyme [Pseudonocardia antarctica]
MPENSSTASAASRGPRLDHVGILVRDLESAVAHWSNRFRVEVARTVEAPAMSISAAFLDVSGAPVELYTVHDADALDAALDGAPAKLDHIALRLHHADGSELAGCAIRGPGRPDPIAAPILMGDATHVWTEPPGIDVLLQLIRPSE